jgi:hypothetical protein
MQWKWKKNVLSMINMPAKLDSIPGLQHAASLEKFSILDQFGLDYL